MTSSQQRRALVCKPGVHLLFVLRRLLAQCTRVRLPSLADFFLVPFPLSLWRVTGWTVHSVCVERAACVCACRSVSRVCAQWKEREGVFDKCQVIQHSRLSTRASQMCTILVIATRHEHGPTEHSSHDARPSSHMPHISHAIGHGAMAPGAGVPPQARDPRGSETHNRL